MSNNGNGVRAVPDPVDAAIAAAAAPQPVAMASVEGTFGDSGRPFAVHVPADISEAEAYAMVELLVAMRRQAAMKAAQRGPRVWTPGQG